MNNKIIFMTGFVTVIAGMALLLRNWEAAVMVFHGVVPAALAVAGLVMMFAASLKK
jgi:hypothetical protein